MEHLSESDEVFLNGKLPGCQEQAQQAIDHSVIMHAMYLRMYGF